ncbi:MAG: relaxase/mobilization nuclease domain-containing protein [Phascolarctobacterium sp.]|nr:relaxase/mobilization nuclease domain-containing protein [Phascolarctobacterium sp.]MBQ7021285.1 relaxase/mobilization nuclease domain-containing protein [Phascolarctobacterium sp.]MBR6636219.1 relaxase/mobilization nuclease domain-containing protein [Phascolarctobacterium sp.]
MVNIAVLIAKTRSSNIKSAIRYADKDRRAEDDYSLCRGVNCSDFATIALEQMQSIKQIYGKEGGRECKHYVLSFAPNEISKENAIEYAERFAEKCFGDHFQAFVGLHTQSASGVLHAHIVVNSVSHIDGYKIQLQKQDLERFKDINDELSREYGLQVIDRSPEAIEERGRKQMYSMESYQLNKKAENAKDSNKVSYTFDCFQSVKASLNRNPRSFVEFTDFMREKGWDCKLRGKNITFKSAENPKHKVRANTLAKNYNYDTVSTAGILYCCYEENWKEYLKEPKQRQRTKQVEKAQAKTQTSSLASGLNTLRRLSQHEQHSSQPKANRMKPKLSRRDRERERDDFFGL